MTLIYEYKGKKYTIEELIEKNPTIKKVWNESIIDEKMFWKNLDIEDLIVETSDAVEEILLDYGIEIEFIENDCVEYDIELLTEAIA